jgi:hypothetical protein
MKNNIARNAISPHLVLPIGYVSRQSQGRQSLSRRRRSRQAGCRSLLGSSSTSTQRSTATTRLHRSGRGNCRCPSARCASAGRLFSTRNPSLPVSPEMRVAEIRGNTSINRFIGGFLFKKDVISKITPTFEEKCVSNLTTISFIVIAQDAFSPHSTYSYVPVTELSM